MPPPIARSLRWISLHLPPLNFITVHYAYFIGVCLLTSVIFWGSSTPARSINYTDSLFFVVSAMTLAGLNTINLSQLNTFQQIILFLLILFGSAIWVSIAVVYIRRKAFERKFKRIVEAGRQQRRERSNSRSHSRETPVTPRLTRRSTSEVDGPGVRGRTIHTEMPSSSEEFKEELHTAKEDTPADVHTAMISDHTANTESNTGSVDTNDKDRTATQPLSIDVGMSRRITFASPMSPTRERHHRQFLSMQGIGARQTIQNHPLKTPPPIYPNELPSVKEGEAASEPPSRHGFLSGGFVARNSQFAGLTLAERERLGGVEYRAVSILAILVPAYFVLWQLLGCIGLGAYVAYNRSSATEVNAENPWCAPIWSLCCEGCVR